MANVPGTSGPVDYPNRPEGGAEGGASAGSPLPGGTARYPEPGVDSPGPQQGAGSGSGGLFPNPGEPADGSVRVGWKGDAYASAAPPVVPADSGLNQARKVSGDPSGGTDGIDVPDTFSGV